MQEDDRPHGSLEAPSVDELEEAADVAAFDAAMAEEGPNVPWEHVVAELNRA